MIMFARFDENPAMTFRVIKETKRYGQTDARMDNVKTVYPTQTKFAGGITNLFLFSKIVEFGIHLEKDIFPGFCHLLYSVL